jgi:hypothetical protein
MGLEDKLNSEFINISFEDTGRTSYRGKHLAAAKNFWKNYFGLNKLTGTHNHTIYEDLNEFHEYINDLAENSSLVVRRQDDLNPAAKLYQGGILIGSITDSRRRGFKELHYERPKSF